MYDTEKLCSAWRKFFHDFQDDLDSFGGPGVGSGQAMDILDYKFSKWPGHGLSTEATSSQTIEQENMRVDEYDSLINNPSDWVVRVFVPRSVGALEPLRKLPHFSNLLGFPTMFAGPASMPDVREAYQKMIDAGIETEKRQKKTEERTGQPYLVEDVIEGRDTNEYRHALFTDSPYQFFDRPRRF